VRISASIFAAKLLNFQFSGIESRLPYFAELGIQAIWLSPIYKSPMKDFGYDISDFRVIDPTFGTLDDFKSLIQSAHDMGIISE